LPRHIAKCEIFGRPKKNFRDRKQFAYLARQVLPEDSASLCNAYPEATQNPHVYVILDFAQNSDDLLRFRPNVFPDEYPPVIYARINDEAHKIQLSLSASTQNGKTPIKKAIIKNCVRELVKTITECVLNVLRGNVTLTACQKKKLQKFKFLFRSPADKRVPLSSKKRQINQRGGFIITLLSAILPTIASLIFRSQNVT
jgi:hypothetical protein